MIVKACFNALVVIQIETHELIVEIKKNKIFHIFVWFLILYKER